ncbi:MAG: hypothetical protein WC823_05510 [Parcubacteria group bacterium]|jgi:hypothetical protein
MDKKPKINFYEGIEGLKDVLRDTLRYLGKEMLDGVFEEAFHTLDQEFLDYYILLVDMFRTLDWNNSQNTSSIYNFIQIQNISITYMKNPSKKTL